MWLLLGLFIALVFLCCILHQWTRHKYAYFKRHNVPFIPPLFPLGSLNEIGGQSNLMVWSRTIYSHFRDLHLFGGFFIGFEPVVLLTDLNLIKSVLIENFSSFPDHPFYINESDDPLSSMLFSLRGERWRNMRTKLSPTFSNHNTRKMFDSVYAIGWDMLNFLEVNSVQTHQPFNAKYLAMRFICDSIGSCGFGLDCGALSQSDPPLLRIADNLFPHSRFQVAYWLLTGSYEKIARFLRLKVFPRSVTDYFRAIISETVQYREENNVVRKDLMNMLMQMKNRGYLMEDESGEALEKISFDELQAQAFIIFFAGFHTSRVTLSLALFELAVNGRIQEELRQEVLSKITADGQLTYDALEEMTFLQQVVDETLRKYPPHPYLTRIASRDTRLAGTTYTVRKGDHIYIPIAGVHYDPEIYPDPDRFNPDRMTAEKMKTRHPCSFLPLGAGPRICLGYRFGLLQVKLGIALTLSKYRLTINSKTKQPLSFVSHRIDLDVEDGIWLNAQPL